MFEVEITARRSRIFGMDMQIGVKGHVRLAIDED
jgi:hypothetical protein